MEGSTRYHHLLHSQPAALLGHGKILLGHTSPQDSSHTLITTFGYSHQDSTFTSLEVPTLPGLWVGFINHSEVELHISNTAKSVWRESETLTLVSWRVFMPLLQTLILPQPFLISYFCIAGVWQSIVFCDSEGILILSVLSFASFGFLDLIFFQILAFHWSITFSGLLLRAVQMCYVLPC